MIKGVSTRLFIQMFKQMYCTAWRLVQWCDMARKNDTVTARVPIKEKRDFVAACYIDETVPSEVIRESMANYVKRVERKQSKEVNAE